MSIATNERITAILRDVKEEYDRSDEDLFIFLFSYFYPQFATKSDSGDFDRDKGKYALFGDFEPTYKQERREQLVALAEYFDIKYRYHKSLFAYLDIYAMAIPGSVKDEELGGKHIPWYGEDSDNHYVSVWTKLALHDEDFRILVEQEEIEPFILISKIQAAINEL